MSNVFDLKAFRVQKDQETTREWLDGFGTHLQNVGVELPVYANGLAAVGKAFQDYLGEYPLGSWWEMAAIPSFGGDRAPDGLPFNIQINFMPGRCGLEPTEENMDRMRTMATVRLEPNTFGSRFATHANLEPGMIYASWLRQCLLKYGTNPVAVQILLFRNIMTEAYVNGMRVDSYSIEGDIFEIVLMDRTSVMRVHLDFQHAKLTGDFLASLKPADVD